MHGFDAGRRSRHRQCLGPPAQRGMVRDGEIETEQADNGADQPFGLPQSQADHDAQRQRRRNRQGRIVWLTAPRGPWFGAPGRDRLFAEPDRQTATLAQASIIFRPVRYPILLPGDVMTAIGIDLERHGRISQEDHGWGSVLPSGTAQPDLPLAEVYGPAVILTDHREVPLSEEGWSSTPTRPQTLAQLIRATRCRGSLVGARFLRLWDQSQAARSVPRPLHRGRRQGRPARRS